MPASCSETITFTSVVNGPASGDPRTAASVRSMGDSLNQRARFLLWLQKHVMGDIAPVGGVPIPVSGFNTTTGVLTLPSHGFSGSDPVRFIIGPSGGAFPSNVGAAPMMYVVAIDGNTFGLSATPGGSQLVGWSGSFSGELYAIKVTDPDIWLPTRGNILSTVIGTLGSLGMDNTWTGTQTWNGRFANNPVLAATAVARAQELRVTNKKIYSDTAASSSAHLANQSGASIQGTIPAVVSKPAAAADWFWLELEIPEGITLTSVTINTLGLGFNDNPTTKPTYQIIKYGADLAETTLSLATTDAHTFGGGNWLTTRLPTTINATGTVIVDGRFRYALLVNSPFDGGVGPQVEIDGLTWSGTAKAISQLG